MTQTKSAKGKVEIFQGQGGGWYWRARAANGKVVADGSEGYSNRSNARRAARKEAKARNWPTVTVK